MNKKVKAYFDKKIKEEKTHPRDWNLKDRFYWIEFLALEVGLTVTMEGKNSTGKTVCSDDVNYNPHKLEKACEKEKKLPTNGRVNLEGFH